MTEDEKQSLKKRFSEASANDAVEGIFLTAEENALFDYMIGQGFDIEKRSEIIDRYLAGTFTVPVSGNR